MEPRYRKHVHAQEMFEKIERYRAGISSQAEFCKQEGLPYSRFNYLDNVKLKLCVFVL